MDMSNAFPSKYLKASDLEGRPVKATMRKVEFHEMGDDGEKPILFFQELDKPMVLNKTNTDTVISIYGKDSDGWIGREIVLFEAMVEFKGKLGPALRLRAVKNPKPKAPLPPIDEDMDDEIPF